MEQPKQRLSFDPPRYTYEDYKKWSDEWELIEGYPYSLMPSPVKEHQRFSKRFTIQVENALVGKNCDCEVYYEFDWIVNIDTVVRPDAMIVCGRFDTKWLTFPPSLILEIASDSSFIKDKNLKFKLYELNNVNYYIMADPIKKKLECYELINGKYQPKKDWHFDFGADCKIDIDFSKMW